MDLRNYRHDGHGRHGHHGHREDAHHLIHYEEFPHREMSLHDGGDVVPHTQEGQELAQGNDVLPHDVLQYDDDHYHDALLELVLYKSLRLPFGHEGNMRVAHIVVALDIRVAYIETQVENSGVHVYLADRLYSYYMDKQLELVVNHHCDQFHIED